MAPITLPGRVAYAEHSTVEVPGASVSGDLPFNPREPAYYQEGFDTSSQKAADAKVMSVQQQVDDTVVIMRDNMVMALQRDEKITNMEDKADELQMSSKRFAKTTKAVKNKQWRNNIKWTLLLIFAVLMLILVVILITKPWTW